MSMSGRETGFGTRLSSTARERVAAYIEEAIQEGVLLPGADISQLDVASQLGVSATPVREAMRDLAAKGLIVARNHRVAQIRPLDAQQAREARLLCSLLEPIAAEYAAARITAEQLREAEQLQEEMERLETSRQFARLNRLFHDCLYTAAQSPMLTDVLRYVHDRTPAYLALSLRRSEGLFQQGLDEHRILLKAYHERDAATAREIMSHHWSTVFDDIEALARQGDIQQQLEQGPLTLHSVASGGSPAPTGDPEPITGGEYEYS